MKIINLGIVKVIDEFEIIILLANFHINLPIKVAIVNIKVYTIVKESDFMNASTFKTFMSTTVSISDLTRAGAKKIFDNLKKDQSKIILKNNKPIAALVSTERYQELLEKEEDLQLMQLAMSRMNENTKYISSEQFYKDNGIDNEYLDDLPEVELE